MGLLSSHESRETLKKLLDVIIVKEEYYDCCFFNREMFFQEKIFHLTKHEYRYR